MTQPLTHLGDMPIDVFLRDYWQKKPLLIRNAFPDFVSPIDGDELAGLALEEEVESRIIIEHGKTPWELLNGPFEEEIFSQLPEKNWSLLVQAVDQWVPEVHQLLQDFRFIPNWRLDDIMISFAPDQGSVGPHFDYYDVFLLQGAGKRHWKVGQMCNADSPQLDGTTLNLLKNFEQTDEWILETGDMLYIPPGIAHWGVAIDQSITYSIGFRAPSHSDILNELSQDIAECLPADQRFSDPDLTPQSNSGEINKQAIAQLREILDEQLTDVRLASWFGRYMTERKYVDELPDQDAIEAEEWQAAMQEGDLLWHHPAARFAFHDLGEQTLLFADGAQFPCDRHFAEMLCVNQEITWNALAPFLYNEDHVEIIGALIDQESLLLDE